MKNKIYNLSTYNFTNKDELLFDANIWLYLFPAPSDSQKYFVKNYSVAFGKILTSKSSIIINSLILSEYLNRYCRIEWAALYKTTYPDFKKFRQSSDYQSIGQRATADAKDILKFCTKKDDNFATANMIEILNNVEAGNIDFNDGLIANSCLLNNWKLITHDGDFTIGGIEILTTNRTLLTNYPH